MFKEKRAQVAAARQRVEMWLGSYQQQPDHVELGWPWLGFYECDGELESRGVLWINLYFSKFILAAIYRTHCRRARQKQKHKSEGYCIILNKRWCSSLDLKVAEKLIVGFGVYFANVLELEYMKKVLRIIIVKFHNNLPTKNIFETIAIMVRVLVVGCHHYVTLPQTPPRYYQELEICKVYFQEPHTS